MTIISSCLLAQDQVFQKLIAEVDSAWPPRSPSGSELDQQCFTLVMRPDRATAARLAGRLQSMERLFGGPLYYGAENLHVTVFGIHEKLVSELVVNHLHRFLAAHLCALQPLTMPIGGLSIVGNTVVMKAFDATGELLAFTRTARRELYDEIYGEGVDVDQMIGLHSEIFWLSAARLSASPEQTEVDRKLLAYVQECFAESMGEAYFDEMKLCRTDQLFRPQNTEVLRRYTLGQ